MKTKNCLTRFTILSLLIQLENTTLALHITSYWEFLQKQQHVRSLINLLYLIWILAEEQTVFKRFSHEYSKAQWEDEWILFQLAFHPKEMWSSHQYLVASATMFGSVAVWNYFIDDTLENEKRPVLWEFKGWHFIFYLHFL